MNPLICAYGIGIFACALILHVILWRIRRPRQQIRCLFILLMMLPAAGIALLALRGGLSGTEWPLVWLLQVSLASAYIMTYPATDVISPTLKIIFLIGRAMPAGLTKEEVFAHFSGDELFEKLLEDLRREALIHRQQDALRLTPRGRILAGGFMFLRRLLGLPIGRG